MQLPWINSRICLPCNLHNRPEIENNLEKKMNPRQVLKRLLKRDKILVAPGCFDGLSARLVEEAGFEAAYLSGGALARSMGIPDIGLVTMSEVIERAAQVVSAVRIPVIADADTGYGNAVNLVRTVREFERTGAAAIHIEDQITPKRCGHLDSKEVIPLAEMEKKLAAALASRTDPDFCIIARTDARGVDGFDDAIQRGQAFAKLGVDAVFVEAPQSEAELEEIPRALPNVPLLVNVFKGGKTVETTRCNQDLVTFEQQFKHLPWIHLFLQIIFVLGTIM